MLASDTVKPFNLAALTVIDLACKVILAPLLDCLFDRVDLKSRCQMSVRTYVCTCMGYVRSYVRPSTKRFFDFNEMAQKRTNKGKNSSSEETV